jgi:hypothetical protein
VLATICEAVAGRRLLAFSYQGRNRVVEPHVCGRDSNNHDLLTAWLVRGYSQSGGPGWRTYSLSEIHHVMVLEERFTAIRAGFNPEDARYVLVHCSV